PARPAYSAGVRDEPSCRRRRRRAWRDTPAGVSTPGAVPCARHQLRSRRVAPPRSRKPCACSCSAIGYTIGQGATKTNVMNSQRRTSVRVTGKILYLTEDAELLKRQLRGEAVSIDPDQTALVNNISTDELTPGWVCYYYDETLARYCLVGLRG